MRKAEVLKIIDEVMNNREIDSIRNAILAIRDKVIEVPDLDEYTAVLKMRGNNAPCCTMPYYEGAKYLHIDMLEKIDSGVYGAYWFSDSDE